MSSIVDEYLNEKIKKKTKHKPYGPKPLGEARGLYKFNEDGYIEELQKVIDSTYTGHYSRDHFQATEFVIDGGHGTGFCIGNILKYAQRYGKKGTRDDARKDLLKVLHYGIIQLYVHDLKDMDNCADMEHIEYKYNTD